MSKLVVELAGVDNHRCRESVGPVVDGHRGVEASLGVVMRHELHGLPEAQHLGSGSALASHCSGVDVKDLGVERGKRLHGG